MIFDTLGDHNNPVMVMINGSFCSGKGLLPIAEKFAEEYYVILPTYDGHYTKAGDVSECSEFTTRREQAKKILQYLKERKIETVELIHGISMGAEVALDLVDEIVQDQSIHIVHTLFDGGPFFHFPYVFRLIMRKKFLGIVHKFQKGNPEDTIAEFLESKLANWILKGNTPPYRNMIADMCSVSRAISDTSVKRESDACYTFDFPVIPQEIQERFVFSYSNDEPANKSQKKMKKCYPEAKFHNAGNLGHCGLLVRKPKEYEEYMRKILLIKQ